ncbi:Hypothetical predicted protein [Paramuricea clavata]|uniref:Uncharacterized protein n=1 Tax=Paramuricea clavata TaxID=317549 RepID=A0A6S7JK34_PARCT|nr:Hypothetical predicted protein [Paramuricea clavata]
MLRREFKIQGQIGEPGHKDKLAYQSLISQIEIGLQKGYTEEEITHAVVRAVQAGLQLRVFASKESDTKIKYDEGLVQGLFLHALETGLADETIWAKMRPLLKNESVADEELIEVMSSAMAAESERAKKFNQVGRAKSSLKVSTKTCRVTKCT